MYEGPAKITARRDSVQNSVKSQHSASANITTPVGINTDTKGQSHGNPGHAIPAFILYFTGAIASPFSAIGYKNMKSFPICTTLLGLLFTCVTTFGEQPATSGLVLYFPLESTRQQTIKDLSGQHNNGKATVIIVSNSPSLVSIRPAIPTGLNLMAPCKT